MANAYSILHNYQQDLYTPNYDLIGSVLQYKQGKLNAHREKLQTVYDQLSVIDVAKGEDKEYVEGRLNTALDIVNQYSSMDLSDTSFTNDLIGKLTETIDDNVSNAVVSTKIYRAENAAWEKLKEENPDLYHEVNRAYAQQGANAWLTDGQAGTKYKGGGGVIEYDDYQKRWQESIPDIAEALGDNYEYITNEQGIGMFYDKVTKRAVDRSKISNIMDSILGEKGKRQQMIDAWGTYSQMDPEFVKDRYDSYYGVELDEADRKIKNLTALVAKKEGEEKEYYQRSLDNWKLRRNSLKSNSFDNLVARDPQGGVRTAYQTLFADQVKDPWLDVYTYDEKVVEREVDDNHVKTLEFQEKIREFNLTYDQKEREARRKASQSGGGLFQSDEFGMPTIIEQDLSIIESPEEDKTTLSLYQGEYYEGVKDVRSIPEVGNISSAKLIDLGAQLEGRDFSNSDQIEVTIAGKKKVIAFGSYDSEGNWIENGNRTKLLSFMDKSYGTTPEIKQLRSSINTKIGELQDKLISEYEVNPGATSDFPRFNLEIVRVGGSDDDPEYRVQQVTGESNKYTDLLAKASAGEALTDAEQLTLDMYVTTHFVADPDTKFGIAREAYVDMRDDLVKKIGWKEFEKLPNSAGSIRNTSFNDAGTGGKIGNFLTAKAKAGAKQKPSMYTQGNEYWDKIQIALQGSGLQGDFISGMIIGQGFAEEGNKLLEAYSDYVMSETDSERNSSEAKLKSALSTVNKAKAFITPTSSNDDAYLSNLGGYDTESEEGGSFGIYITDMNKVLLTNADNILEESFLAPEAPQYMLREEDTRYEALSDLVQSSSGVAPSGPITIALDVDQFGNTEGNIIYQFTDKDGNIVNSADLEPETQLTQTAVGQIGLPISSRGRTPYDGRFGSNAPKINLGISKPSKEVEKRVSASLAGQGRVLAMNNSESVSALLQVAGDVSPQKKYQVAQEIIDFRSGKYKFSLEASDIDKQYHLIMYKGDKRVESMPVERKFYEEDLASFMAEEALYFKHAMFNDYLNTEVLNSEVDRDLQVSQAEVLELLQNYGQTTR